MIGLVVSSSAALAWAIGHTTVAVVLLVGLITAATLEGLFAVCLGCVVYRFVPNCEDCDDITERLCLVLAARQRSTTARRFAPIGRSVPAMR